jgi:membrane protein involved in colicin uptake
LTCTLNPVTHAAPLIHRHTHIQEDRRQQALEKYREQEKEDAVRRAEVAKKIAAEEQARAKQEKALLANALLTKANAQAEEYLKQAAIRDLDKDDHGRSSKPLFEHVNVHKAGCGGEVGA